MKKKESVGKWIKGQNKGINTWEQEWEEMRARPQGHPAAKIQQEADMRREEEKEKRKLKDGRESE